MSVVEMEYVRAEMEYVGKVSDLEQNRDASENVSETECPLTGMNRDSRCIGLR